MNLIRSVKNAIRVALNVMVLSLLNVWHVKMDTICIKTLVRLIAQMNFSRLIMFVLIVINSASIVLEKNQINAHPVLPISIFIQNKTLAILNVPLNHF